MTPTPSSALVPWPLVVVIEDCFVPELLPDALKTAESASNELISAVIACRAYQAEQELAGRRN